MKYTSLKKNNFLCYECQMSGGGHIEFMHTVYLALILNFDTRGTSKMPNKRHKWTRQPNYM